MRPIDADDVLAKIDIAEKMHGNHKYLDWKVLRYFVGKFQTLDFVAVGRCEKCCYCRVWDDDSVHCAYWGNGFDEIDQDGYCYKWEAEHEKD